MVFGNGGSHKVAVEYDSDGGWKLDWSEDEDELVIMAFWVNYLFAAQWELSYGPDLAGRAQDYRDRDLDYWALRKKVTGLVIESETLYDVVVERHLKH